MPIHSVQICLCQRASEAHSVRKTFYCLLWISSIQLTVAWRLAMLNLWGNIFYQYQLQGNCRRVFPNLTTIFTTWKIQSKIVKKLALHNTPVTIHAPQNCVSNYVHNLHNAEKFNLGMPKYSHCNSTHGTIMQICICSFNQEFERSFWLSWFSQR